MMKKIIILVFGIYLTCLTFTNVSAMTTAEEKNYEISNSIIEEKKIVEGYIDGRLRSLQLPTNSLDLSRQSYRANIVSASSRWLYTDVYFKTASNNKIVINYNLYSNNGQNAKIGIYDMTTGSWVKTVNGLVGTTSKSGLNSSHKYAVAFAGNGTNTINGSAIISN